MFASEDIKESKTNSDYTIYTEYEYVMTPESIQWDNLTSEEKLDIVNIPIETATKMNTEALLKSMIHNPRISVIFFYEGGLEVGIEHFCEVIPALRELLNREDLYVVLSDYLNGDGVLSEHERNIAEAFIDYLNVCNESQCRDYVDPIWGYLVTTVYTPAGSGVSVDVNRGWETHNSNAALVNSEMVQVANYYGATIVTYADPTFNCHSYAWYFQSSANYYWMSNPSAYMTDGSYSSSSYAQNGRRVTYFYNSGGLNHTGVVYSVNGSNVTVISKWGYGGILIHTLQNCPYYDDGAQTISYWY